MIFEINHLTSSKAFQFCPTFTNLLKISVTDNYGQESRVKESASLSVVETAGYSQETTFTAPSDQDDFNLSEFVSKPASHDDPNIKLITTTSEQQIEKPSHLQQQPPTTTVCHLSVLQAPLIQKESTSEKAQSLTATFSLQ